MNIFNFGYGKFCGEHPLSRREKDVVISKPNEPIMTLGEGMVISGVQCEFRVLTIFGYQSFCSSRDRILKGCEHEQ